MITRSFIEFNNSLKLIFIFLGVLHLYKYVLNFPDCYDKISFITHI